jgi:hypothetical protein
MYYVEIKVSYEFFGQQEDLSIIGPFQDLRAAEVWSEDFNIKTLLPFSMVKITSKVVMTPTLNQVVFPAHRTQEAVIGDILNSMTGLLAR